MAKEHELQKSTVFLTTLIGLNTALLVASNAAGCKLIALPFGLSASATVFSYAFSFTFTDIISEIYGQRAANLAVRIGFAGLILSVTFFFISIHFPSSPFWKYQKAYETILGFSPRMIIGGWTSYAISQHLDVWIFHKLKNKTHGRYLWLRNNGSTLISQFIDTVVFITIVFYGSSPLWKTIFGQYIIKLIIALLDTPIVYIAVKLLSTKFIMDLKNWTEE